MSIAAPRRYNRVEDYNKRRSAPMIYMKWTPSDLATLETPALYTEVDEDGWVQREFALGADGVVAHQLIPCSQRPGWFGLARISSLMLESNVSKAEFESLWNSGVRREGEP
jgi:hypothetical protein